MSRVRFRPVRGGLDSLARSAEVRKHLEDEATAIRDRARSNARSISSTGREMAIAVETGSDDDGAFADIGYLRGVHGFELWWTEVGTIYQPARPHLRPAVARR